METFTPYTLPVLIGASNVTLRCDRFGQAVVNHPGGHQPNPRMMMLSVIPSKEINAKCPCILGRAESFWELGAILHRLELAFRERIVV